MKTDTEVKSNGLEILVREMGAVDAERFIALILKEPFDYTKWQKDLFAEGSVDKISRDAMTFRNSNKQ